LPVDFYNDHKEPAGIDENMSTTEGSYKQHSKNVSGACRSWWSQSPLLYAFTHRFAELKISVLQIWGLTAFKKRPSRTHMAREGSFQIVMETLCCYDLLLFPDDLISASYLVKFMIPSAL